MPELRWILLLLGVLFVVGLGWWELRRARREPLPRLTGERDADSAEMPLEGRRAPLEPTLTLPELRAPQRSDSLPVLEVADESMLGLRIETGSIEADRVPREPPAEARAEPTVERTAERTAVAPPPVIPIVDPEPAHDSPGEPIVDWPPEGHRRIVAARLVAGSNDRFSGRAVRQALAAEGFVAGKLSIFHRPGEDGRALVSAASLNKPGTFDLAAMDAQRFPGLFLFIVLPGPLPATAAFDQLIASARALSERLQGALQDEQGEPLGSARALAIREALADEYGMPA
jgi:cell division protein ZipA